MLRRVLMRRAYNAGRYEQARYHARLLLGKQKEAELARSVIVRSYWNEQALAALVEQDFSWWAKVYPPGFDLLPARWREPIETKVRNLLPVMPQPYALHDVNHFGE
ncbi:MAG TPA: hypothetical protein D7H89_02370 [Candidatus Poseidoniales archaeon]|nr:MAG TPA: hypothetical protein D7H89_02370 [Candidatus Poseidoniales archaeon]HII86778.1 hypothetical protein [Candidatus Poseidoniaceae archaeon]